jgi:hypothetical protein
LIRPLHDIQYWFVLHGVRHFKTVHFYLMEAVGGDTSLHDHEYDVAEWFPIAEAERKLAFANERLVVAKACAELAELHSLAEAAEARDTSAAS